MPTTPEPATLSRIYLFRGLTLEELERLASSLHERGFSTGASVMTAEQPGEAVFVVLEDSVKVHLERPDGMQVILAALGPGEVVGEMSLADSPGARRALEPLRRRGSCGRRGQP